MARQRGVIKFKGTVGGLTFLASGRVRAARGTYKEARINDVLQGNADKSAKVGALGSPILKQLKAIEQGFVPGNLWARMNSSMFKAKSMKVPDLLESLKGIELNERYSYSKLFSAMPGVSFTVSKKRLVMEMEVLSHPGFARGVKASHYLCEVHVLFLDGKGSCLMDMMETEWISIKEDSGVYEMGFMIPKGTKYFLVVEGVRGGRDGKAVESFLGRGFRIGGWGKC
jgi:hypothetical protein